MTIRSVTPTVSNIEPDHEHLKGLIDEVTRRLDEQAALARTTVQAIERLRTDVLSHFTSEESSPLFRDVNEAAPWVRQAVAHLVGEHAALRHDVDRLVELAVRQQTANAGWSEFARDFAGFSQRLLAHEHGEVDVWQRAHNDDLGTKD